MTAGETALNQRKRNLTMKVYELVSILIAAGVLTSVYWVYKNETMETAAPYCTQWEVKIEDNREVHTCVEARLQTGERAL